MKKLLIFLRLLIAAEVISAVVNIRIIFISSWFRYKILPGLTIFQLITNNHRNQGPVRLSIL